MPAPGYRDNYRIGLLACLTGVLLLCIAVVRLWPVNAEWEPRFDITSTDEVVQLQAVTQTRQEAAPPPPPEAVAPPISVPDAVILSEEPLDLEVPWQAAAPADGSGSTAAGSGHDSSGTGISGESPQPVHFAEPSYPPSAWQQRLTAQIVVEVRVSAEGRATSSQIIERYRLEHHNPSQSVSAACCSRDIKLRELAKTANRSAVDYLGHGLEAAALTAARKWRFKPPTKNGNPLASFAILTFTFGR